MKTQGTWKYVLSIKTIFVKYSVCNPERHTWFILMIADFILFPNVTINKFFLAVFSFRLYTFFISLLWFVLKLEYEPLVAAGMLFFFFLFLFITHVRSQCCVFLLCTDSVRPSQGRIFVTSQTFVPPTKPQDFSYFLHCSYSLLSLFKL